MEEEKLAMAKGDHIKVQRIIYTHHGIDFGDDTIVHFTGEPGNKSDATIKRTSIEEFLQGGSPEIIAYEKCFPPSKVINRALELLGKDGYNLFNDNCEHFARYCKTGQHESEQVTDAKAGTGAALGTYAATAGGIAAVSAAGTASGLSAAGVMSGLAAIGPGGAIGGIATLGVGPAIIANIALSKTLKDDEHLPDKERNARQAGRTAGKVGAVAGTAGAIATVSAAGTTVGLSAAGITSGLAAIGGTVGGGMAAGAAITVAAPAVAVSAVGIGVYKALKWLSN